MLTRGRDNALDSNLLRLLFDCACTTKRLAAGAAEVPEICLLQSDGESQCGGIMCYC